MAAQAIARRRRPRESLLMELASAISINVTGTSQVSVYDNEPV